MRIVTLGDSTLDSGRYSGGRGTSAPELLAGELGAELVHLARDGHTVKAALDHQLGKLPSPAPSTALIVSIGGNDLLYELATHGDATSSFEKRLDELVTQASRVLAPEWLLVANIYDPSSHDPAFAKWIRDLERALALHARFNEAIARVASKQGAVLVDLCGTFRAGSASPPWIVSRIEPSAAGAIAIAAILGNSLQSARASSRFEH